jgi:hypothetical protein
MFYVLLIRNCVLHVQPILLSIYAKSVDCESPYYIIIHSPLTSSFLDSNMLTRQRIILRHHQSSLMVRDLVSHSYKTTDTVTVLYVLICTCLNRTLGGAGF